MQTSALTWRRLGSLLLDERLIDPDQLALAFEEQELVVREAFVDEGPTLKRFRPRAQGRANRILKRTSHITVVLAPRENTKGSAR